MRSESWKNAKSTVLSVEDQALLRKVSTTYSPTEDRPIWHGETGTTYGGAGFSPLFRTIHFPLSRPRVKPLSVQQVNELLKRFGKRKDGNT